MYTINHSAVSEMSFSVCLSWHVYMLPIVYLLAWELYKIIIAKAVFMLTVFSKSFA